jgi:hypothetical protein
MDRLTHENMINNLAETRRISPPFVPQALWEDMRSELIKVDVMALTVPIYQKYFSESDMRAIVAFHRTAPGKKLLQVQQPMFAEVSAALNRKTEEIARAVYQKHEAEIQAAQKKYEADQAASGKTQGK